MIVNKCLMLNTKFGNLIASPGVEMAVAVETLRWVKVNNEFSLTHDVCS